MVHHSYQCAVGRLLEIKADPFRTVADVDAMVRSLADVMAKHKADKFVIAADWRAVSIMPPDTASRTREMLTNNNLHVIRSGILTLPENPMTNLQVVRLIREAENPERRHFTSTAALYSWLSEILTRNEAARLREFLGLSLADA